MNLPDLVERLNAVMEELEAAGQSPADVEVLTGAQPTYPIAGAILGVVNGDELELTESPLTRNTVWLPTEFVGGYGERSPYAPRALWDMV